MTAVGIIMWVLFIVTVLLNLFFIYVTSASEEISFETKKIRAAVIFILACITILFTLLFLDEQKLVNIESNTFLLAFNNDEGQIKPAYQIKDEGRTIQFSFYDSEGTILETSLDTQLCNFTFTDDFSPCVVNYEAKLLSKLSGRNAVGEYYYFYLPTLEEENISSNIHK